MLYTPSSTIWPDCLVIHKLVESMMKGYLERNANFTELETIATDI